MKSFQFKENSYQELIAINIKITENTKCDVKCDTSNVNLLYRKILGEREIKMKTITLKKSLLSLNVVIVLSMTGCGGGGGGGDSSTPPPVTANTISLSGTAVDGYISGAKVCLDVNSDAICQSTEPSTITAVNGTFSFTNVEVADNLLLPVIVMGGAGAIDTATGKAFTGQLKNIIDSATITAGTPLRVTPLTDLVSTSFLQSTTKNTTALNNAKTEVAQAFGLSVTDVVADPMQSLTLFAKTQELEQIKALIETTATKAKGGSLDEAETQTLQNDIKEALVAQVKETTGTNLEIDKVLTTVETQASISIPENEKTFVVAQATEVKTALATLATSSTTLDELDELQIGLEAEQEVALTKIEDATASDILAVVVISDVEQLIAQSNPVNTAPTVAANAGFSTPPTTPTY